MQEKTKSHSFIFPKTPTGVDGLDEITEGGFPQGRPTLICGGAGCGKTLLSMQFLIKGITEYDEPGVFMSFEEPSDDLTLNVKSLGFDLEQLKKDKKLVVDHVRVERSEIEEAGEYDLDGLFIRLGHAIDSIKATRVVLDTIESLFAGLDNQAILRAELRRLFHWLKTKGVTAVITGERGEATLTRQGLEEYVSDCVIVLDHRVIEQVSTRRLRIVKYRGSTHGTNEYPFLIDEDGISVLPITSLKLDNEVSSDIISTGVPGLNEMFHGGGFYRGSNILVSGTAGTAKTTVACYFANEQCEKNERTIYFAFEESPHQLVRNMRSIGIDLEKHIKKGILQIHSSRPSLNGLELHLLTLRKLIKEFEPTTVIIDPISNLISVGSEHEVRSMLVRLIDMLKAHNITAMFTSLNKQTDNFRPDLAEESVSSLVDTWITVRDMEGIGERNRGIFIIKARGMGHSNQVREFVITSNGIELLDVELGPQGILTGAARQSYQFKKTMSDIKLQNEISRKDREIERKRKVLEANIEALRNEFESAEEELSILKATEELQEKLSSKKK
ncbi:MULTISPECIES: circadian clock protein KaiC [Flavobacterium]|uniref:non-specific serine/threonine protein kinase n=1 Tax=Flavobacterium quisquiliarum TaxID=1834436 RepID=A0ABV8W0V9_9FLAO|nr:MULTISPECIES: circadian clock protein KaiC [Flavobacterium]MBW1654722.1 circadian clock protein KaiC [Flavobacterium quisquiliarum]NWL01592.1 KaiC 1 [Flavobacterium collinsii]